MAVERYCRCRPAPQEARRAVGGGVKVSYISQQNNSHVLEVPEVRGATCGPPVCASRLTHRPCAFPPLSWALTAEPLQSAELACIAERVATPGSLCVSDDARSVPVYRECTGMCLAAPLGKRPTAGLPRLSACLPGRPCRAPGCRPPGSHAPARRDSGGKPSLCGPRPALLPRACDSQCLTGRAVHSREAGSLPSKKDIHSLRCTCPAANARIPPHHAQHTLA